MLRKLMVYSTDLVFQETEVDTIKQLFNIIVKQRICKNKKNRLDITHELNTRANRN